MTKLLGFVGATVGGYAGWALGAPIGIFSAFVVSMIGTGVGMYYGRRIGQNIGANTGEPADANIGANTGEPTDANIG